MSSTRFACTRVVKRLAPHQPGAIKLAQRFGDRLVCVRYRHDLAAAQRYTTVELVVDQAALRPRGPRRPALPRIVALRTEPREAQLRQSLLAHGAVWDSTSRLWYLDRGTAKALGLLDRLA